MGSHSNVVLFFTKLKENHKITIDMKTKILAKLAVLLAAIWMPMAMGCTSDETDIWNEFGDEIETEAEPDATIETIWAVDYCNLTSIFDLVQDKSENIACIHSNDIINDYNEILTDTLSFYINKAIEKQNEKPYSKIDFDSVLNSELKVLALPKIDPNETLVIARVTVSNHICVYGLVKNPEEYVVAKRNDKTYIRMINIYDNLDVMCLYVKQYEPTDHVIGFIVNKPNLKPSDLMIDVTIMNEKVSELGKDRNMITATSRKHERIAFPDWELNW